MPSDLVARITLDSGILRPGLQDVRLRQLATSLREHGYSVTSPAAETEPGAKGADIPLAVLASVAGDLPAIQGFASVMTGWLRRSSVRRVRVEIGDRAIELSRATPDEQRQLVELFIAEAL